MQLRVRIRKAENQVESGTGWFEVIRPSLGSSFRKQYEPPSLRRGAMLSAVFRKPKPPFVAVQYKISGNTDQ